MIFARECWHIMFSYYINGSILLPLITVNVIVGFTNNSCFCAHMHNATCNVLKLMNLIRNIPGESKLFNSLKSLCCVLVKLIVCSIIWEPRSHAADVCIQVKRV